VAVPVLKDRSFPDSQSVELDAIARLVNDMRPTGERAMAHERIERNPKIMVGKPVIRGTRITVEHVLRKLGAGMTVTEIIADHPRLTVEDIRAAQAFAADYLADEEVVLG
jgi:uncharacterized protein (DUF433 family)